MAFSNFFRRTGFILSKFAVLAFWSFTAPQLAAEPFLEVTWVTVGDAGNTADTTGFGAVADAFRIMTFEWTNGQYAEFLNAVDPQGNNPNSIYNMSMGSNARGGISFSAGNADGTKYAVRANMGDKPVNFVSWYSAARVANWVNGGALVFSTTDATATAPQNVGAYTLGTATSGTTPAKNSGASVWIPTENEWYKAAFYKGGSTNAGYWDYATTSDSLPTAVTAGGTGTGSAGSTGNFANYNNVAGWNAQNGNVTSVGTNGGSSAYGTYDQAGNLREWNDLGGGTDATKGIRGGSWSSGQVALQVTTRTTLDPSSANGDDLGFRLVSVVPEPSSTILVTIATVCLAMRMRRESRKPAGR